MIKEEDIKRIRDANDIVELIAERVILKQRGREFWGNCPFHNEKTPSFKVDPASQFYHCFGCGEGGDVFKFVMKTEGLEFIDAARALAQRKSIEIDEGSSAATKGRKARLFAVCEEACAFFHHQLMRVKSPDTDAARAYLSQRDMGGNIAKTWQLGYAQGRGLLVKHLLAKGFLPDEIVAANVAYSGAANRSNSWQGAGGQRPNKNIAPTQLKDRFFNRVMFPIFDLQGRAIAFGGRVIGAGEPKYLNSSDTLLFHKRENLFAIHNAKAQITAKSMAIVVEGYTDVIAMHKAGFVNTVATLGTALTPEHLKLLSRFAKRTVLLFDGDEAGKRAADRAVELITLSAKDAHMGKLDLFVAVLPSSLDPADFIAAQGQGQMQQVIDAAVPLLRFALDRRLAKWDLDRPEQRNRALSDVVSLLAPIKDSLLATDYTNYLADVFAVDYQLVATALKNAKPVPGAQTTTRFETDKAARHSSGAAAPYGNGVVAPGGVDQTLQASSLSHANSGQAGVGKLQAMESELLWLYIEQPEVRARLKEAYPRITWSNLAHKELADALLTLDANAATADLLAALATRYPDASSLLSQARLTAYQGVSPNHLAGVLMFSIREEQLKAAIKLETIKLRRAEKALLAKAVSGADAAPTPPTPSSAATTEVALTQQKDELFAHVAQLQLELNDLRRKYNAADA